MYFSGHTQQCYGDNILHNEICYIILNSLAAPREHFLLIRHK